MRGLKSSFSNANTLRAALRGLTKPSFPNCPVAVVREPDICTLVLVTLSEQVAEVPPPVRAGRSALELKSTNSK